MTNLDLLSARLKSLATALTTMKAAGVSEEILICWLRIKTGLSQKDIKIFLSSTQDFFDKLICEDALEKL